MARLLILFSALVLALSAAAAAASRAPGEVYWNKVLPKTPIPTVIKDLLIEHAPAVAGILGDNKSGTSVGVGKGGVAVNTGKPQPGTRVNVGKGSGVSVNTGGKGGRTNVNVGKGGVNVSTGKGNQPSGTGVNVGHGGVTVTTPPKRKPVIVGGVKPFLYEYAATDTQIHDDPNTVLFFLEKDLKRPRAKMTLHFTPTSSGAAFLSRQEANSIPFSSSRIPEILKRFSVQPDSLEAAQMSKTLSECEEPAAEGERKLCATSLESMVDFTTASLGTRDVRAVSTAVDRRDSPKQVYTVVSSSSLQRSNNLVVCHSQSYAYAVFYCHKTRGGTTRAYRVSMVGENDRTRVDAVAVCHTDTSAWNPKHVAFRVLGVKPGTVPVCHFLPQDHVVWTASH